MSFSLGFFHENLIPKCKRGQMCHPKLAGRS